MKRNEKCEEVYFSKNKLSVQIVISSFRFSARKEEEENYKVGNFGWKNGGTKEAEGRVFGALYLTTSRSRVLIANRGMKVERDDGWRSLIVRKPLNSSPGLGSASFSNITLVVGTPISPPELEPRY